MVSSMSAAKPRPQTAAERMAERAMQAVTARGLYLGESTSILPVDSVQPSQMDSGLTPKSLVRLTSWPDMRMVPADKLSSMARVCALLSRQAGMASLVSRRLGLPESVVYPLMNDLWDKGLLRAVSSASTAAKNGQDSAAVDQAAETETDADARTNIWSKLMRKLLG